MDVSQNGSGRTGFTAARADEALHRLTRALTDAVPDSTTALLLPDGTFYGSALPSRIVTLALTTYSFRATPSPTADAPFTQLLDGNAALWVCTVGAAGRRLVTLVVPARDATAGEIALLRAVADTAAVVLGIPEISVDPAPVAAPDPLALHDPLTHLPDARLFDLRLVEEVAGAQLAGQMFAVITIDLDGLRHVNERLGRALGDRVLKQVASRLHHAVRRSDVVARVGEDEFSLICPVTGGGPEGAHLPLGLLETLGRPMNLDGHEVKLGASVGVALYPIDGADAPTLRRNSVTALHRAKLRGINQFEYFTPGMNAEALGRRALEADLRRATEACAFELHYQPIVGPDRRVDGLEALIRWHHPERGMVSPMDFIPLAEQTGLIVPIGTWVLSEVTRQAAAWARSGQRVRVACNVSPVQFLRGDFVAVVTAALAHSGLAPTLLELELTEGVLMNETTGAIEKLQQLRRLGVTVAVDDFGTGYSSLSRLHRLPIDRLKIDRSFVSAVAPVARGTEGGHSLRHRTAVVRSVVSLARNLDLRLVAEGVETERQFRFLRRMGYDALQGYLFSKPVPASQVPALLARLGLRRRLTGARKVA